MIIQEHNLGHVKGNVPPRFSVMPYGDSTGYVSGAHGYYGF
ncbi:hypothetical protein [Bombiscardovia apis]